MDRFGILFSVRKITTSDGAGCERDSDISESFRGAGAGLEVVALGVVVGVLVGFKTSRSTRATWIGRPATGLVSAWETSSCPKSVVDPSVSVACYPEARGLNPN
jgi:hypothetical protein